MHFDLEELNSARIIYWKSETGHRGCVCVCVCVYSVKGVRAPPVIVLGRGPDTFKIQEKKKKELPDHRGAPMPSKRLALAPSDVAVLHCNPDARPAPSTLLSPMSARISRQPPLNAQ